MANQYVFNCTLEGFVKIDEDGGKYNNRTFAYTIPSDVLSEVEADREELLKWAKSKVSGRSQEAMTPWDENGSCKYTYGAGDGSRKAKPSPVFVDTDGSPVGIEVLRDARKGTKVQLIVRQKPYAMGSNIGTSMQVVGVMIIELVTGNGAVDSGELSVEDVASLFKPVDGFKQSAPAVREVKEESAADDSYDF